MVSKVYKDFKHHHHHHTAQRERVGDVHPDEIVEVSVFLKPRPDTLPGEDALSGGDMRTLLTERRARHHLEDIKLLTEFATEHGLTVSEVVAAQRLVKLSGTASAIQAAFDTVLGMYADGEHHYRGRDSHLRLPEDLHDIVADVMGLTTRPACRSGADSAPAPTSSAIVYKGYLPNAVGALYDFPSNVTGKGQCIGILQFGGGFLQSDLNMAFAAMELPVPVVTVVSVDGTQNTYNSDTTSNAEIATDIQVAAGNAPGAAIVVYFGKNTYPSLASAMHAAVFDSVNKPSVISMSWGSAEPNWPSQTMAVMNDTLSDAATIGISVFLHSGDYLSTDQVSDGKVHVNFPASSPWGVGCGGTQITLNTSGDAIASEAVWNTDGYGTGGGVSAQFKLPSFQETAGVPLNVSTQQSGRGVPDVAGSACPVNGYSIVVGGAYSVVGGTSAVAPLWAGLTALINEATAKPIGFLLPALYQNPQLLRVITEGNNIPPNSTLGYAAGNGWSACTGLGVPIGTALFEYFTKTQSGQ